MEIWEGCRLMKTWAPSAQADKVSGLISISDLQKPPVRAWLFTLVTASDTTMSQVFVLNHGRVG